MRRAVPLAAHHYPTPVNSFHSSRIAGIFRRNRSLSFSRRTSSSWGTSSSSRPFTSRLFTSNAPGPTNMELTKSEKKRPSTTSPETALITTETTDNVVEKPVDNTNTSVAREGQSNATSVSDTKVVSNVNTSQDGNAKNVQCDITTQQKATKETEGGNEKNNNEQQHQHTTSYTSWWPLRSMLSSSSTQAENVVEKVTIKESLPVVASDKTENDFKDSKMDVFSNVEDTTTSRKEKTIHADMKPTQDESHVEPTPTTSKPEAQPQSFYGLSLSSFTSRLPSLPSLPNVSIPFVTSTTAPSTSTDGTIPAPSTTKVPEINYVCPELPHKMSEHSSSHEQHILSRLKNTFISYINGESVAEQKNTVPNTMPFQKVVIIGVHGWFPTKWLTYVIGEPTGTSTKFVSMMTSALSSYVKKEYSTELPHENITTICLESNGTVMSRVNSHFKTLQEHSQTLREADHIFVVAHSQGTPVTFILLDKLLSTIWKSEDLTTKKLPKITVLCMAGIAHGPVPLLRSNLVVKYLEQVQARELFDFCSFEPGVGVTNSFVEGVKNVLKAGASVTVVGSWFDQVVPLHSAILHHFTHPRLHKCFFVTSSDARMSGDFLVSLVTFAVELSNRGIYDYGLMEHVSEMVLGSIYGGTQGHSLLYEDATVYQRALKWALEDYKNDVKKVTNGSKESGYSDVIANWVPNSLRTWFSGKASDHDDLRVKPWNHTSLAPLNPYYLPWIFAKLSHSSDIQDDSYLRDKFRELHDKFEKWDPKDARWRDIKLRLDFMRSKL